MHEKIYMTLKGISFLREQYGKAHDITVEQVDKITIKNLFGWARDQGYIMQVVCTPEESERVKKAIGAALINHPSASVPELSSEALAKNEERIRRVLWVMDEVKKLNVGEASLSDVMHKLRKELAKGI